MRNARPSLMLGNADYCVDIIMIILFVFFSVTTALYTIQKSFTRKYKHTRILDDATNVRVTHMPITTEWFI